MFPIGTDGILGEVQIGALANERPNRWPEVPTERRPRPVAVKRLQATILHNEFMDGDPRTGRRPRSSPPCAPNVATAIRSYLTDGYEVANAGGSRRGRRPTTASLFERFDFKELRLVNRVVESWFVFAELHWVVGAPRRAPSEARCSSSAPRTSRPIDADGRFWVRTGVGTDPVPTRRPSATYAPYLDERGPTDRQGWEFDLVADVDGRRRARSRPHIADVPASTTSADAVT